MDRVSIVTDSTSDIPHYIYKDYDLTVIPLTVLFGGKIYIDNGFDIEPEEFYKMLQQSTEMPAASQPTPGVFINTYKKLLENSGCVVSVHISSKLSGTVNSANLAAKQVGEDKVAVIDSEVVHMHCGFLALKAAKLAGQGASREDIIEDINNSRKKINAFFIPRSMENLIKGGRVSKIKGKMATLLEIKPILTIKNGEVSLFKNTRKWELAKKEMLNIMESNIKGSGVLTVSIGHVAASEEANYMEDQIKKRFNPGNIVRTNIGIVVGSHLGIGGLGITFFEE
ncbi:MAG: DegV domain-containing protein [Actinobacteria bacterium ADurb.Bin346]|nr:MAG: DegV domain-containing protein [Actinobacteria bacterium ADurb.Bin346]